mgnify:CR=1 FL=1
MKKLLLPLVLLLVGVGAGVGAGLFLLPQSDPDAEMAAVNPCGEPETADHGGEEHASESDAVQLDSHGNVISNEYAKLNNQFVVPIVEEGLVSAMVVLALSIEVPAGNKEAVFLAEPKLRDAFLQAMFDHANVGGFSGNFTSTRSLRPLREDLVGKAKAILPGIAKNVLIIDIVRQDV